MLAKMYPLPLAKPHQEVNCTMQDLALHSSGSRQNKIGLCLT